MDNADRLDKKRLFEAARGVLKDVLGDTPSEDLIRSLRDGTLDGADKLDVLRGRKRAPAPAPQTPAIERPIKWAGDHVADGRVNELAMHWKSEYDREIAVTLETRVVSGIEDYFYDTSVALFDLLATRSELETAEANARPPERTSEAAAMIREAAAIMRAFEDVSGEGMPHGYSDYDVMEERYCCTYCWTYWSLPGLELHAPYCPVTRARDWLRRVGLDGEQ